MRALPVACLLLIGSWIALPALAQSVAMARPASLAATPNVGSAPAAPLASPAPALAPVDPTEQAIRLLAERPTAVGLAVPAMPLGSPGMETPQGHKDPYETLLVLRSGAARVFARHNQAT